MDGKGLDRLLMLLGMDPRVASNVPGILFQQMACLELSGFATPLPPIEFCKTSDSMMELFIPLYLLDNERATDEYLPFFQGMLKAAGSSGLGDRYLVSLQRNYGLLKNLRSQRRLLPYSLLGEYHLIHANSFIGNLSHPLLVVEGSNEPIVSSWTKKNISVYNSFMANRRFG